MKYDDASWHFEHAAGTTEDERWNNAAAHIGVYLKWCFEQGWAGELHNEQEASGDVNSVIAGAMTGTEFLLNACDAKFTDEDLTREGNAFTAAYYDSCLDFDIWDCLGIRATKKSEVDYDLTLLYQRFAQRFSEWEKAGRPEKHPSRRESSNRMATKYGWRRWLGLVCGLSPFVLLFATLGFPAGKARDVARDFVMLPLMVAILLVGIYIIYQSRKDEEFPGVFGAIIGMLFGGVFALSRILSLISQ